MAQLQARGKASSRERFATAFKSPALDGLRHKILLETTADDFFAVSKCAKPSTICFLKRLHHLALSAGWITAPTPKKPSSLCRVLMTTSGRQPARRPW